MVGVTYAQRRTASTGPSAGSSAARTRLAINNIDAAHAWSACSTRITGQICQRGNYSFGNEIGIQIETYARVAALQDHEIRHIR